ncbi:50S ribosomal protein L5 [bacterium]|nr:50S ribosomal protein L5 [bacterium]
MVSVKQKYNKEVIPALQKELDLSNLMSTPRLEKVVVNIGVGQGLKDSRFNEVVVDTLTRITGQKPVSAKAKTSISNFKIREGMTVGYRVTLRGPRMYDFVDRLINVTLPRVRDFRGLSRKGVDAQGNLSIGFKEHIAFPEIKSDEVERIHGLEVTIVTTAKDRKSGLALFGQLGFPLKKVEKK